MPTLLDIVVRRRAAMLVAGSLALALPCGAAPIASAQESASPTRGADARQVPTRTLRPGDRGAQVRKLQRALTAIGFRVKADGEFGRGTKVAVQRFQATVGLSQSGVAGAGTRTRLAEAINGLSAATENSGGFNRRSLKVKRRLGDRVPVKRGMSGRDVKMLQDFLRRAGFKVSLDGEFGRGTRRAVRAFERRQRRRVDGVMDAGDIAALRGLIGADLFAAPEGQRAEQQDPGSAPAPQLTPGERAQILPDGTASVPEAAPEPVKRIIMAANQIAKHPYIYGGGHRADWKMDRGYDCSGSVSWALHGVPELIDSPRPSGGFYTYGEPGPGKWVTIYTNDGHMYAVIAGLRFDTSGRSKAGTRWQADMRSTSGYTVRHVPGL